MRFSAYINNSLQNFFSKKSKIDGRFLILAILLVYFSLIFIDNYSGTYPQLWRKFGVPAINYPFADLKEVLAGFDCVRSNKSASFNSCNFGYPPIWFSLSGLGLDENATLPLGFLSILIFYLSSFLLIGRLNYQEGVLYSLLLCSPPLMLLVERCNVDIIIYSGLFLALVFIKNPEKFSFRLVGYLIILGLAFLKLFPIFGLAILIKEKRKTIILIGSIFMSLFGIYCFSIRKEMKIIGSYFLTKKDWMSFGYRNIFYKINTFYNEEIFVHAKMKIIFVLLFSLSLIFSVRMLIDLGKKVKFWLSKSYLASASNNIHHIDAFRLGSSIYIGNFIVIGKVFDYKFAFLLFAIPQILLWIKSRDQMSVSSSFALLGILATFYLSQFNILGIDEIINWLLLGYFIYSFCQSWPEWLTRTIHNTLSIKKSSS